MNLASVISVLTLAAPPFVYYRFCQSLGGSSVLDGAGYGLSDGLGLRLGLTQGLGAVQLELQGYVLQDAPLQCGQQGLQVWRVHVALGQPLDQGLGQLSRVTTVEQHLQLLTDLG